MVVVVAVCKRLVVVDRMERSTDHSHARDTDNACQPVVEVDRCRAGVRSKLCALVFSSICLPCIGTCLQRRLSRRVDSLWCPAHRSVCQGIRSMDLGKLVFSACMDQKHRERGSTPDGGLDRKVDNMGALLALHCICKKARKSKYIYE